MRRKLLPRSRLCYRISWSQGRIDAYCPRVCHQLDTWHRQNCGVSGKLIVSVSGICERTLDDVAEFCALMDTRAVPVSLLVAPRLKGGYRLDRDPHTVEWLADRRAAGDAILLNGYDQAATKKRRGVFAALLAHVANFRGLGAER